MAVILRPLLVPSGYAKKYRHPHSRRGTRVALSNAVRRDFSLGRYSISGPTVGTVRNLSDRVSKNQKRCGAAQGVPVTNHRQQTVVHPQPTLPCSRPRRRQPGPRHPRPGDATASKGKGTHHRLSSVVVVASTQLPSHPYPYLLCIDNDLRYFASIKTSF